MTIDFGAPFTVAVQVNVDPVFTSWSAGQLTLLTPVAPYEPYSS